MAKDVDSREEETPWYKNPTVLAALAAGGLGYGLSRRPSFSTTNKHLARLQHIGATKGFHRIVDVSRMQRGNDLVEKLRAFLTPQINRSGKLDTWNRLKLWLQEGGDAIPVATGPDGKAYRVTAEGLSRKPATVDGLVFGRGQSIGAAGETGRKLVRGGVETEGSADVQRALTRLGRGGKGVEAKLLLKYAPDAIAETQVGLPRIRGGQAASRIKELQARLEARFKGKDYLLKQPVGVASGGLFPRGADDWSALYGKYRTHLTNVSSRKELRAAVAQGGNVLSNYLRRHGIYEGYVLEQALKKPSNMIAQRLIPGTRGEWRVHSLSGSADPGMMVPRYSPFSTLADPIGTKRREMQEFVQNTMKRLPAKYRRGDYGMDVMEYRTPSGKRAYKIIEMNPTELPGRDHGGGRSGFLEYEYNPGVGHHHYRLMTGRHTVPMALRNALLTGGAAGGLVYGAKRLTDDTDDRDASVNAA